jgi:radical SAM superfamily enzyme YgiQ (UPF0313 family)
MKQLQIALISANNFQNPYPVYPLGISYLSSYLLQYLPEVDVLTFDFNMGSYDDYAQFLDSHDFVLIGISLRNFDDINRYTENHFIPHYKRIMETTRAHASKTPVVIGGSGFSAFPQLLVDELQPDYGIHGEGEESLRQLAEAIINGNSPTNIEGLLYKNDKGSFLQNGRTHYISKPQLHVCKDWVPYYWKTSGMMNVQTKRGCPYHCIFCSYPLIDGQHVRTLDASMVVQNIEEMYREYGIDYLFFTDSVFNIHKEYNEELSKLLIEAKMPVRWGAYFSPSNLTLEELKLYQEAGLTHIEFGTDALTDQQLANYQKLFHYADIKRISEYCSDLSIFYAHFLILGGYGETEQSLDEAFSHSKELGLTIYFPYIGMRIYPNTRLSEIALEEKLIQSPSDLVNPVYYVSKDIDATTIPERARKTGQRWVFPDDKHSPLMNKLRQRGVKGPLWEYYRYA